MTIVKNYRIGPLIIIGQFLWLMTYDTDIQRIVEWTLSTVLRYHKPIRVVLTS